jgi:hypothetical protein
VQNTVEAIGRMGHLRHPELGAALVRALRHPKESVQNAAMAALVAAGDAQSVRAAGELLDDLPARAHGDWIRAARRHLPTAEAAAALGAVRDDPRFSPHFAVVVDEILQLPAPVAAELLVPMQEGASDNLAQVIAAVRHAAGDTAGTHHVLERLRQGSADARVALLGAIKSSDLTHLLDDVLRLSVDPDPAVRAAVVTVIAPLPGENIDNVLTALAVDLAVEVRQPALAALRARGRREVLDRMIERVRTASGTKLVQALGDLAAAGDESAIPVMVERLREAPPLEQRKFIQAIGRSKTRAGFDALVEVFLAPEQPLDGDAENTTLTYAALLLPNPPPRRGAAGARQRGRAHRRPGARPAHLRPVPRRRARSHRDPADAAPRARRLPARPEHGRPTANRRADRGRAPGHARGADRLPA